MYGRRIALRERMNTTESFLLPDKDQVPCKQVPIKVRDKSDGGIGFCCKTALKIGQRVTWHCPDGESRCLEMRWGEINRNGYRFGAAFIEVEDYISRT